MNVAVSATTPDLNADIDPRFGRCQRFLIVDTDTLKFKSVENSGPAATGGAGISTAQNLTGEKIDAVITGNCGPNAYQVLKATGIEVFTGASGKVKDAIDEYNAGKLQASVHANVAGHFGTGGSGRGRGRAIQ